MSSSSGLAPQSQAMRQLHLDELAANWALAQELEPLVPIDPLS
jgi:hypothetical protein